MPLASFQPMTDFVSRNAVYLDGYERRARLAVIYSNAAAMKGDWQVKEIVGKLHEANIAFDLLAAGDEVLQMPLRKASADGYELVLVPGDVELMGEQALILDKWLAEGKAQVWNDGFLTSCKPDVEVSSPDVWALVREKDADSPLVIHLLNRAYDADTDTMKIQESLKLRIGSGILGNRHKVSLHAPGGEACPLVTRIEDGMLVVEVSELELWALLVVR